MEGIVTRPDRPLHVTFTPMLPFSWFRCDPFPDGRTPLGTARYGRSAFCVCTLSRYTYMCCQVPPLIFLPLLHVVCQSLISSARWTRGGGEGKVGSQALWDCGFEWYQDHKKEQTGSRSLVHPNLERTWHLTRCIDVCLNGHQRVTNSQPQTSFSQEGNRPITERGVHNPRKPFISVFEEVINRSARTCWNPRVALLDFAKTCFPATLAGIAGVWSRLGLLGVGTSKLYLRVGICLNDLDGIAWTLQICGTRHPLWVSQSLPC